MQTRFGFIGAACAAMLASAALGQSDVVISQVYGGGGNTGAMFTHDFIELFNRSANPVNIGGWSVQYASSSGNSWTNRTNIPADTILQPGQYFLIQQAAGSGGSVSLPTPDLIGNIAMGGANGKVALVNDQIALTGTCPVGGSIVDFIGYGSANCSETAASGALGNTTAAIRGNGGCTDTNNNSTDFSVVEPSPRNSASSTNVCTSSVPPSGVGSAQPNPVCRDLNVVLSVAVTLGSGPSSPIASVIGDTTQIGGGPGVAFLDDGVSPDLMAGDGTYTAQATIGSSIAFANHTVSLVITDALGRMGLAGVPVTVTNCSPSGFGSANPAGTCAGNSTLVSVTVFPGILPPSTGLQTVVDLSQIGGSGAQNLFDDGTNGDVTAGDNVFSFLATVAPGTLEATYALAGTIFDDQGRVGLTSNFNFSVVPCVDSSAGVVISQVYGGGGNSGATFTHDFVELFNRTDAPVDLTGRSIQYASASSAGGFSQVVELAGVIAPRRYYLVQMGQGAGGTQPLPTPDLDPGMAAISLGSTSGRVALVSDLTPIGADCLIATTILDLVAYGGGTNCWEGFATAPSLSNTTAANRSLDGCQDFNQNVADFVVLPPNPRNSASPANLCGNTPACPQDFNNDGSVDPDDLGDYINCYFSVPPCDRADFNNDGSVDPDDLGDFINVYFGPGC
ncbi:MAG: lamin tail domain-containing protein [Phycisphaerales bacterium]